ncbi:4-hydroxy-tetrahydrodipicolinate synthase [Geitlerinema splendidum]|nr:4-hydroxy-tetrahydrodipicolinate synthase [Geitlerinema splendidum]
MGSFFAPRDWGRLLTAMLTPFDSTGNVNYDEAARIANYLVDEQKNDGIVVNGTTGESPTLTHEEKFQLLKVVLDTVGDRAAVVMGAGTYNTTESIELAKESEAAGAHGVMLVNPYYNKPGQDGLYAHFSTIAQQTDLPVMLYNIAPRSSINLETDTLMRLAEIKNIVAVKEASGNLNQIADVCMRKPDGFRVYSGDDALTLPILSVGGHGVVSVAAHLVGSLMKEMIDTYPTNPTAAAELNKKVLPVVQAVFSAPSPVPVKYGLSKRGFDCESVRLPLVPLNPVQKQVVDKVL